MPVRKGEAEPILVPGLDLRRALRAAAETGAAFVPQALAERFRQRLQGEVEACPFEPVPDQFGPVHQETELCLLRAPAAPAEYPAIARLRHDLVAGVRAHARDIPGLEGYEPNAVFVQRYRPGTSGISPHRDGKRFVRLVAVFTTRGTAAFSVCRNRAGETLEAWEAGEGSLVLLRGPGLGGLADGRPFHTVAGPVRGERYSVTFRTDTRP